MSYLKATETQLKLELINLFKKCSKLYAYTVNLSPVVFVNLLTSLMC